MDTKEFEERVSSLRRKMQLYDLEIQDLIRTSNDEGKLANRKEQIFDLIEDMFVNADWLRDALDNPSQIQNTRTESR